VSKHIYLSEVSKHIPVRGEPLGYSCMLATVQMFRQHTPVTQLHAHVVSAASMYAAHWQLVFPAGRGSEVRC
jgi:hypothetical protein